MIQVIAILCLAIYGSIISLLVGLKMELAKKYNISDAKAGMLFSSFMLVGAISVIVLSSMIDVLGHRTVTLFGFGFTALSLVLLSFTKNYKQSLAVYIVMSLGAMCIISVGNTILPQVLFGGENASAATNLGNAFYGVGAFLVSYYLTNLLGKFGYRRTVLMFAGLLLLCAALSLFAKFPVSESKFSFAALPSVLTSSFYIIALLTNFFGAGVENGICSWANTYMSRQGATDKQANSVLSLFFVAVFVSRLVTATFVTPSNTPVVLLVMALLTLAVLVTMVSVNKKIFSAVCLVCLGLLVGSICPNIFGYMFSKVDPAYHGTGFGLLFATGLAGGSVIPGLVGAVSKKSTLRRGFTVNMVSAILFGVCAIVMILM